MGKADRYDVFVLGAGPGGYPAAVLAAKKGLRVGIAEGSRFGGTCTNTGCIPTKTYIESVNLLQKLKGAARFAVEVDNPRLDLARLKARKDRVVSRLAKGVEYLLKHHGVDVFPAKASISEPGVIRVDESIIEAEHIIIATGSRPKNIPQAAGAPGIWTSDEVFDITVLPRTLAVIGGGVIGMEMAHIFSNLGTAVTVVEAMDRILPLEDRHVSEYLAKIYRKIDLLTSAKITGIEGSGPYRLLVDAHGSLTSLDAEKVLLCTGREPVLPPGMEEIGLARTPSGGIRVNEHMQTSVTGIYAVGDVTGEYMYAYTASREAAVAVDHITGGAMSMSYRALPSIVFTSPEVASVGSVSTPGRTGTFPVSALGRARTMEENDGYARVDISPTGAIERVSIVAPHASELISWAALAINEGLSAEEFLGSFCPHPTLSEVLKEAMEDSIGSSVHHP